MPEHDSEALSNAGSQSLSRRGVLLGALAALPLGCSKVEAHQEQNRRRGGELRVAFDAAGVSSIVLDPQNSAYAPHNRAMRSIFDSLTRLNPDQSVSPWLAESWTISPDRTVYEFTLKPGIKFHNGQPLDAKALKWNFDRIADPKNATRVRIHLGPYLGSEVIDELSVRLRFKQPFTPLLRNLSMTRFGIVAPNAVAKWGKSFNTNPVGTGPFRFVKLEPGRAIHLERNPDYDWAHAEAGHRGPAHLERLVFLNVPEEMTRIAVVKSGQVQAADLIPPQNLSDVRADPDLVLLEKELLNSNYALTINVTREPWDDEECRLALRLALDIDHMVRSMYFGNFPRAWSYLNATMFGSGEKLLANSWKPDPERSRRILEGKGWKLRADGIREKDGKRLEVILIDSQGNREKRLELMQIVRYQLRQVGVRLTIDSQPGGVVSPRLRSNGYDFTAGAQFHPDPDVLRQYWDPSLRLGVLGNRIVDPEIIDWLNAASREPDGPSRAAYYYKVQQKILDKTYAIPFYILPYNLAVSKSVKGVVLDNHGFPEFYDARFV